MVEAVRTTQSTLGIWVIVAVAMISLAAWLVGVYIVDNYQKARLFHAITHPSSAVMATLVEQILAKLDIRDFEYDEALPELLAYIQVPIHPLVIDRLGLKWASTEDRYKFNDRESLTFDEYVRRYIRVYG